MTELELLKKELELSREEVRLLKEQIRLASDVPINPIIIRETVYIQPQVPAWLVTSPFIPSSPVITCGNPLIGNFS